MQESFSALGVSAPVIGALERRGITAPFPVQNLVLPDALGGVDVLVASPTGSGKTLAFGIPVVERATGARGRPAALVLVPTRELASQVVEEVEPLAAACSLRISAVYGGTSVGAQAKRARGAQILVATPGRLRDLIERRLCSLRDVRLLVLDEADRMLDMGFRPQVDRVLRDVPVNRQTLLFSATLAGPVMGLARKYTSNAVHIRHEHSAEYARGDIEHQFVPVTSETKLERLAETIEGAEGLSLVFVRTRHGADRLARKLVRDHDLQAVVMHGDMSQNARERSLARFEAGKVSALVATDVAARGLDVDAITRGQLRSAWDRRGLRPPCRPHWACRPKRDGRHPRPAGAADGRRETRDTPRPRRRIRPLDRPATRATAAAGILVALMVAVAAVATFAPHSSAAGSRSATNWYWTAGLCKSRLNHYGIQLDDGRSFYNANEYCVGIGGLKTCEWSSGYRTRLYTRFAAFVRAYDGTIRAFTLIPAGKTDFRIQNVRALGHEPNSAKFDSFIAPIAAGLAHSEQQKGCAPYSP